LSKKNGHDSQIVEDEINNSLHLQILIDIVNQEKHGSLLKKPRSNKNPIITDPSNGFRLASKKSSSTEINFTKEGNIISHGASPAMFIDALIRDDKGQLLFRLDELVETCYTKWHDLAIKYGCNQ
jgi:hypothetical protein